MILEAASKLRMICWVTGLPYSLLPQLVLVPPLVPRSHTLQNLQFWELSWQFGSALCPHGKGMALTGHLPKIGSWGLPSGGRGDNQPTHKCAVSPKENVKSHMLIHSFYHWQYHVRIPLRPDVIRMFTYFPTPVEYIYSETKDLPFFLSNCLYSRMRNSE